MKVWSGLTAVVACLVFGSTASATISMVTVGNAGNVADNTGYGAVGYTYNIGKYEVTAGQYAEFLNAVATTDTYSLYNTRMARTDYGSGITRSGSPGSFIYTVDQAFVDRPVNYVSWYDVARFTNWLTTGDTESGVYDTTTWAADRDAVSGTAYYIPTEDEWYKAAYYKGGSANAGYWLYPTQNDSAPGQDMNDTSGNNANYRTSPYIYPIDSGKYTTKVGEFQNSDSAYGTFDQGGNVWEWNEAVINSWRGLRGGAFDSFVSFSSQLASSLRGSYNPVWESNDVGFRVASSAAVPEPGSLIIWACGGFGALLLRRRRK